MASNYYEYQYQTESLPFLPTPTISFHAAFPVLSRRDYFLLEVVKALLSLGESWKDQYDLARVSVGYTDAVLKEADKIP